MNNLDTKLTEIYLRFKVTDDVRYKKLAEECSEYLEAYFKNDIDNLKKEAADVHNVVRGLLLFDDYILKTAIKKANRTIRRIKKGYYK